MQASDHPQELDATTGSEPQIEQAPRLVQRDGAIGMKGQGQFVDAPEDLMRTDHCEWAASLIDQIGTNHRNDTEHDGRGHPRRKGDQLSRNLHPAKRKKEQAGPALDAEGTTGRQ